MPADSTPSSSGFRMNGACVDPTNAGDVHTFPDSLVFGPDTGRLDTVLEDNEYDSSDSSLGESQVPLAPYHPDLSEEHNVVAGGRIDTAEDQTDETAWIRRPRRGAIPDERTTNAERVTPLEKALTGFAERDTDAVITPSVGLTFDSLGEAYDFFNLYSWEIGFGIRYAKCRLNVKGSKCMQEMVCCCAGKPSQTNSTSCRCQCQAMIRLLRTDDEGWYINEFRSSHNHALLHSCAEKLHFASHRHIDKYTRELVSQLRQNNVNLTKVYSVIGTFFGRVQNVPFTKRCLRTLCGKLSREQADDDVRKTMNLFSDMKESDNEFSYNVQVDDDSRIRTLMWSNGRNKIQYNHFGDVVTFDTTYKTNLYNMPFGMFVGVNNHFQSVIYAGVLMRDETVESFVWVFKEFAKMMGGKNQ